MLLCVSVCAVAGLTSPARADSNRSVALILDASGSMKVPFRDGTSRIVAAKAAVEQLVGSMAASSRLSFWAYGHQSPTEKKDCKDIAQLAPFGAVSDNKSAIIAQTRAIQAQGYTPITESLRLAAENLATEEAASHVVVLVSDGRETCQADPCAAAKALADANAKLVVHTVGVGVDTTTRMQLQCIANNARGKYFDANSAVELARFVGEAAVKEAPPEQPKKIVIAGPKIGKLKLERSGQFIHKVVNDQGKQVADFAGVHKTVDLAAGIYGVTFPNGVWTGIEIKAGETTEIKPGYLEIKPIGKDFISVLEPETGEKVHQILWNIPRATLMPGRFDVKFGNILWPGGIELKPGETLTLKPAVITVKKSGGPLVFFVVKTPDGQEAIKGDTIKARVALPPGKYVLELDMKMLPEEQRRTAIEVTEGQEVEIKIE